MLNDPGHTLNMLLTFLVMKKCLAAWAVAVCLCALACLFCRMRGRCHAAPAALVPTPVMAYACLLTPQQAAPRALFFPVTRCTHPSTPYLLHSSPPLPPPPTPRRLWSRFFCLSVYVTMYLNDHQRKDFYQTLGMNVDQFDRHVITETNRTTERIFPVVRACWACWAALPGALPGVGAGRCCLL